MNHFISGILKIILLEGSIALLIIDRLAPDRVMRAQRAAFSVLAGLMVVAWANYGGLRGGAVSPGYVLSAIPLVLGLSWLFGAALSEQPSQAMQSFRDGVRSRLGHPWHAPFAIGLSVALAFGWVWFGHRANAIPLVHQWEQYHFYLGAKYQREIGWFDIYKATVIADRESVHALAGVQTIRDAASFEQVPVDSALADADRIHARFGPERWEAFKADWVTMTRTWGLNWAQVVNDHGNSNSPAWSIIAHPIATAVSLSAENQSYLGWLDMLLMLFLWLFVFETSGHRVACVGLLLWATPPNVFDYLAGSFLRWDWLFAVGLAAAFLKRNRYATAGALFGYAVASKLFPLFFGVALLLRVGFDWWQRRVIERRWVRFFVGTVASGLTLVAVSTAMFGVDAWKEYQLRIETAQVEKYYGIQYSLKTVFLQLAAPGESGLRQGIFPSEIKQARADVEVGDYAVGFLLARLLFTLAVALLARRATEPEAFLLGPLLVFTWLTVNMYYWSMLGLLGLGLASRTTRAPFGMLLGQHLIFMVFFVYQHLNRGLSEAYAVAFLMCAWILGSAAWEWLDSRRPQALSPAPQKP
jgi:hypothetical protein